MKSFSEYLDQDETINESKLSVYLSRNSANSIGRSYRAVKRSKNTNDKLDYIADLLVAIKAEGSRVYEK